MDDEFLDLLCDGPLQSLSEYAREARYPVDLQFRRDIRTGIQRVQLYVGLQRVLAVYWRSGQLRLAGHSKYGRYQRFGFDSTWDEWMDADDYKDVADEVDDYLELVIPKTSSAAKEGAVQSAISSFQSRRGDPSLRRQVLDREFTPQFLDATVQERVMSEVSYDLLNLLPDAPVTMPRPSSFGQRLDVLAVRDGRLQAIEVKPKREASIVWAPLQVLVYARLVRRWLAEDAEAGRILARLAEQRRRLGLLDGDEFELEDLTTVTPVIAVQRGGRDSSYLDAMKEIVAYLAEKRVPEAPSLEVAEVSLSGRLRPLG
ncbi:hypothetical protein [Agromyces salentinus]|uniref:hypothetical protein n=1 Tax=Agromyces salentinus TaxID=269421 RepID=UPI0012FBA2D2|nr:hypothetical protein [Agromyces salentinus]